VVLAFDLESKKRRKKKAVSSKGITEYLKGYTKRLEVLYIGKQVKADVSQALV